MSGELPVELEKLLDLTDKYPQIEADREPVKILVMGSRQSVNQIVYQLHQLRFAEFNEWSRLLPAPVPGEVMRILVRYVYREPLSAKPVAES